MRIHHFNCGTHCPFGGMLFDGRSRGFHADICTHCVLLETANGLVLVDTGYGLQDVRKSGPRRLARLWPALLNTQLREEDTAIRQVEALGYCARDVRHIVLTHLDFDHAGGVEDFPEARIHVMAAERSAAEATRLNFIARQRYRPSMWDSVRDWRTYSGGGENWFGFETVRALDGLPPEILLVPLRGHTLGHAGVAIRVENGWLFNAGDSFMHHDELDALTPRSPVGLKIYQSIMSSDRTARLANQDRLRALNRDYGSSITIFASHDTARLALLKNAAASAN